MNIKLNYTFPVFFFYSFLSFGQTNGDYTISGTHSKYGAYQGRGWIHNGVVQRLVRFNDYRFEEKEIEQIWTGSIAEKLNFKLSQSNLLTSFNGYSPSDESFKTPIEVSVPKDVFRTEVAFNVSDEVIKEQWRYSGLISEEPLWQDLRNTTAAVGEDQSVVNFIRKISGIDKVIDIYRELPEISAYKDRPEFKSRNHYVVRDKTDADFYLKNPHVLRITNKTINPLSLAEAQMRRNAYGQTLLSKEKILRYETLKYNFNKVGNLENATIDEHGNHIGKIMEYDTALWSAMFGWAEFLRYKVTKDPEALKNFRLVLEAILIQIEIPNDPKEFARGISVSPVGEDLGEGWVQGEGKYAHLKWRQGGNNDMAKGLFITLILAHQIVKDDEVELKARIQKSVKALARFEAIAEREYNLGIAEGLDALWNNDEKKLADFYSKTINFKSKLGSINDIGTGIYFGGIADWSGIHLSMTTNFSQFLLSQELQTVFTNGKAFSKAQKLQKAAEDELFGMYHMYENTRRDYLMLMIGSYIPRFQQDPKNAQPIKEALWSLKEIPAPRSFGTARADLYKHPHWSVSAWPSKPWKAMESFRNIKEDYDFLRLRQGAYAYPIFEGLAWNCNYFWKHQPYEPYFESDSSYKTFSADYLLVYWAGRASGLITDKE